MTDRALDSSVALALLLAGHAEHAVAAAWRGDRRLAPAGHALAETYSVLTRLPGDMRVAPVDADVLLGEEFDPPLLMKAATFRRLPAILSSKAIVGGAVYDALVGLAAADNGITLASLDRRARQTYEAVGAVVEYLLD